MKQIFHHFTKWEDYKAGFYNSSCSNIENHIASSIKLLSNQDDFYIAAIRVINEWVISCEQNLTDTSINKIAYIGQSACCMANGTPSFATKRAWAYIDDDDKILANQTAKKVLNIWLEMQQNKDSLWQE
jgi:hypothetical protein